MLRWGDLIDCCPIIHFNVSASRMEWCQEHAKSKDHDEDKMAEWLEAPVKQLIPSQCGNLVQHSSTNFLSWAAKCLVRRSPLKMRREGENTKMRWSSGIPWSIRLSRSHLLHGWLCSSWLQAEEKKAHDMQACSILFTFISECKSVLKFLVEV